MQIRRLRTGSFEPSTDEVTPGASHLDKRCLLVYAGKFESMDGEVHVKPEHLSRLVENHNGVFSKLKRLAGAGEVPIKHMPPLQLDHSTSAKDTVGRLMGPLEMGEHVLEDGTKAPAVYGTARVLGKENVEKVHDGRWVNLSIGADLENGKLTELTITPFPAAPEAQMLSRVRLSDEQTEEEKKVLSEVEMPGHVDEALWEKAKRASQDAFGKVKWPFVTWWYKEHGGKMSKMSRLAASLTVESYPHGTTGSVIYCAILTKEGKEIYRSEGFTQKEEAEADGKAALERIGKESTTLSRLSNEGEPMHEHLKAHLKKLGVADEKHEGYLKKMHGHLMTHHKMGEDEANEAMKHMTSELWDKYAEHMNKMGAAELEHADDKMPHSEPTVNMEHANDPMPNAGSTINMSAETKAKMVTLMKNFKSSTEKVQLAARTSRVMARLSALKKLAKITPAEIKKLDIKKFAAMDDKVLDAVFEAYNAMEPKVFVGAFGTQKAEELSRLRAEKDKKTRMTALEKEVRANMSSVPKTPGEDHMGETEVHIDTAPHEHNDSHMAADMDADYDSLKKLMAEDDEKAKEHLRKMMSKYSKHLAGEELHPSEHELSEAAEEVKKMHAHLQELVKLTGIAGDLTA